MKKKKKEVVAVHINLSDEDVESIAASVSPARDNASGLAFEPSFRNDSYSRYWPIIVGKKLIVEQPLDLPKLATTGVYDILRDCDLLETVDHKWKFVRNLVLEFYANLSKTTFDPTSPDFCRTWVRGHMIEFSPRVINEAIGRDDTLYEDLDVSLHKVAKLLTRKTFMKWPSENAIPSSRLSVQYSILHKVAIRNWMPLTHRSSVNKSLAVLLYKIGKRIPINFGHMVFTQIASHAETLKIFGAIGFPGLIHHIITKQADVLRGDDVFDPEPKFIIISPRLYNEALHVMDVEGPAKGVQKSHGRVKVASGAPVAGAVLQTMASRVVHQLEKEYAYLGKCISKATERRNEIESVLYDLRHGEALNNEDEDAEDSHGDDDGDDNAVPPSDAEDEDENEDEEDEEEEDGAGSESEQDVSRTF